MQKKEKYSEKQPLMKIGKNEWRKRNGKKKNAVNEGEIEGGNWQSEMEVSER